jgi:hypothetical protein
MMGSANVDLLKGRTMLFGGGVGLLAFFALAAVKALESRGQRASDQ